MHAAFEIAARLHRVERGAGRELLGRFACLSALLSVPLRASSQALADAQTAADVLNVADFEALARARLPPAHFGFLATGADDDRTVVLNHEAYSHLQIR